MSDARLIRYGTIFASRLKTLDMLLGRAATQWRESGHEPEVLAAGRLAQDMLPLPHQIVFACNQANDFATWCGAAPASKADVSALSFGDLQPTLAATVHNVEVAAPLAEVDALTRMRRVGLSGPMYVELPGERYIDDWLLPNFYFHIVTAYDILRHLGVKIGKAEFMAHLIGDIRRTG